MFLEDKLRERLPRSLQQIEIVVMPRLPWEPASVVFTANGRSAELEVDPETGLTDVQVAHLCAVL
jgi:hypothetical protein